MVLYTCKKGELPKIFERKVWFNKPEGLYITAVLSLVFAIAFNLEGISSIISFVFLIIYLLSHFKLSKENKAEGNRGIISLNFIIIFSVLILLNGLPMENFPKFLLN